MRSCSRLRRAVAARDAISAGNPSSVRSSAGWIISTPVRSLTIELDLYFGLLPGLDHNMRPAYGMAAAVRSEGVGPRRQAREPETAVGVGEGGNVVVHLRALADRYRHTRYRYARGVNHAPRNGSIVFHLNS